MIGRTYKTKLLLGTVFALFVLVLNISGINIKSVFAQSCGGSAQCGELQLTNCPFGCTSVTCGCTASCNSLFGLGCVATGGFCTPDPFLGCGCYNSSCYVITPTPTPAGSLCDNWASPNSCHQNSGDGCYYECNSSGTGWNGPYGSGCSGSCGGGGPTSTPPPPPSGGACSGITYALTPDYSKYEPDTSVTVTIDRAAGVNCSGNWDDVEVTLDGVNQGIAVTGATTYETTINTGTSGLHTLQFTVNNGTCTCNTTTINTMPEGNFDSAACTLGQPYDDLSYDLTSTIGPFCNSFDRVRYWLTLNDENPNDTALLDDIGRANRTWEGDWSGGPELEYLYMIHQVSAPASSPVTSVWDELDTLGASGWTIDDLSAWTVANGQSGRTYNIGGNIMCDGIQNDWIGGQNVQVQPDACEPEPVCNSLLPTYGDLTMFPGEVLLMSPSADTVPPDSTDTMEFSVSDTSVAYFYDPDPSVISNPFIDAAAGFQSNLLAVGAPGTVTDYTISAYAGAIEMCSQSGQIDIDNPPSWWQAAKASVFAAGGSVMSEVPPATGSACATDPLCDPNLITFSETDDEYPGAAIAGTGSVSAVSGNISEKDPNPVYNWVAEGAEYANLADYDYDFFESKVKSDISSNWTAPPGANLTSGGYVDSNGYRWFYQSGPLTISNPQNIGSGKVVLFVDGNVTIENTINVDDGTGFFMLISSGDVTVSETVGGDIASFDTTTPELEGVIFADGEFETLSLGDELDTLNYHVRGSLVVGSVTLGRSLTDNSVVPGEYFEYGADQMLHIPRELRIKRIRWREIAP